MRWIAAAGLALLLCLPAQAQDSGTTGPAPDSVVAAAAPAASLIYPPGSLSSDPRADRFTNEWLSPRLRAMGESALGGRAGEDVEIYRLLVLPRWLAIRVERVGDRITVDYRELATGNLDGPWTVWRSRHFEITEADWDQLAGRVEDAAFFAAPGRPQRKSRVRDGAVWFLEGLRDGRHHVVYRQVDDQLGPIRYIGTFLLALAERAPPG